MEPLIIYEDNDILVFNKPAGLLTHPDGRSIELTLADWVKLRYPTITGVGLASRPGIVHRLDQGTSGVIVVAKTQVAYLWLTKSFSERAVAKGYRLLTHGVVKKDVGTIAAPIGRSRRDPRRRAAYPRLVSRILSRTRGPLRPARTDFRVLTRFREFTYLEAYPQTGRTHQLRVHFQSIQYPIVGDELYAHSFPTLPTIHRPALHAYYLRLPPGPEFQPNVPATRGRPRIFLAPLPSDFFATLAFLHQT